MPKFTKENIEKYYIKQKRSSAEIAKIFNCSQHKVNYWIKKYKIPKRSISDAVYVKNNPNGDPFHAKKLTSVEDAILFGLGIGLYWGEGTKKNTHAVRLGNTDPELIKQFLKFLQKIYSIDQKKLRFGLQIFSDMSTQKTLNFWQKELNVPVNQFFKVIVTPSRGVGNYREKSKYGVLTVYFGNKKLRDIICKEIENI